MKFLRKLFYKTWHFVESILMNSNVIVNYVQLYGDISRFLRSWNSAWIAGQIPRRSKRGITRVDSTFRVISLEENDFLHLDSVALVA